MKKFLVIASFGWEGPFLVEDESENEAINNLEKAIGSLLDESPIAYALARPGNQISDTELNDHFSRQGMKGSVKCLSDDPLGLSVISAGTYGTHQYSVCTFHRGDGVVIQSIQPSRQRAKEEKAKLESEGYELVWIQEAKADISLAID